MEGLSRLSTPRGLAEAQRSVARQTSGFTLVEVMAAAAVMVLALLCLLGSIVQSYRIGEFSRKRDQVRAVLQSYVDEFQRMDIAESTAFFETTDAPTGLAMAWKGTRGEKLEDPLKINLETSDKTMPVTLTRWVREVNESTGAINTDDSETAAGKILVATFEATYEVNNRQQRQSLTVARCIR